MSPKRSGLPYLLPGSKYAEPNLIEIVLIRLLRHLGHDYDEKNENLAMLGDGTNLRSS